MPLSEQLITGASLDYVVCQQHYLILLGSVCRSSLTAFDYCLVICDIFYFANKYPNQPVLVVLLTALVDIMAGSLALLHTSVSFARGRDY